jgi:pyruvate ferredoxin oxidoreductase alpha subunit
LCGRKAVGVIDQNLSIGSGGITHTEIVSALYTERTRPPVLSFIGGLGGKDLSTPEFNQIVEDMRMASITGETPTPRLLYTNIEQAQMSGFLKLAGKEV